MPEEEIKEGNKLIAEFMNLEKGISSSSYSRPNTVFYKGKFPNQIAEFRYFDQLKYHNSYDWLMPVVEKIENLGASTEIHHFRGLKKDSFGIKVTILGYDMEYDNSIFDESNHYNSKLESVYKAVVEFIKWYNENK